MMRFRMVKINVDQFAILADKAPSEGVTYVLQLGFSAAPEAKRVACAFSIEFAYNDKSILKLSTSCEFDVHKEDWNNCIIGNLLRITKEDLGFFANQTVGATRGILFCKTEHSDFRDFILPPIDLSKILNEDLVIDLSGENKLD